MVATLSGVVELNVSVGVFVTMAKRITLSLSPATILLVTTCSPIFEALSICVPTVVVSLSEMTGAEVPPKVAIN